MPTNVRYLICSRFPAFKKLDLFGFLEIFCLVKLLQWMLHMISYEDITLVYKFVAILVPISKEIYSVFLLTSAFIHSHSVGLTTAYGVTYNKMGCISLLQNKTRDELLFSKA